MLHDAARQIVDWDREIALIKRHRVASLTLANIEATACEVPECFRNQLASMAMKASAHDMMLLAETLRLVDEFARVGISCRVIKGVAAAQSIFGRMGVRYSSDIDILIDPRDVQKVASLMCDWGYVSHPSMGVLDRKSVRRRMVRYKDLVFEKADRGIVLELHWRLFENRHIFPAKQYGPVEWLPLSNGPVIPVLPPETADLYMCFHGAEHAWARLKWLADLAALLSARPEWAERVYGQAVSKGRKRLVGPGLALCEELYGIELPRHLTEQIRGDRRMRALIAIARDALVGEQDGTELEDRQFATTRKNISHYLMTNDPRHWFQELFYDLTHAGSGNAFITVFKRIGAVMTTLLLKRRATA